MKKKKSLGKLILGIAAIGAAVAGGIAYLNKSRNCCDNLEDDFDDFDDDFEDDDLYADDDTSPRGYVPLDREAKEQEQPEADKPDAEKESKEEPKTEAE